MPLACDDWADIDQLARECDQLLAGEACRSALPLLATLELMPCGVVLISAQGAVLAANIAARRFVKSHWTAIRAAVVEAHSSSASGQTRVLLDTLGGGHAT